MAYIILVGIVLTILAGLWFLIVNKKSTGENELSWRKCILTGSLVFFISLFLGALATSIFQYADNAQAISDLLVNVLTNTIGLFFYATTFSLFLVLPSLILALKFLSKTSLDGVQKQLSFVIISFALVIILNAIMTDFFSNLDFMIFLEGFSFFGIVIPWYFAWRVYKHD